jgi:hypothetical protein
MTTIDMKMPATNRVDGSAPYGTECASHTTERMGHVFGGSQRDGLSSM